MDEAPQNEDRPEGTRETVGQAPTPGPVQEDGPLSPLPAAREPVFNLPAVLTVAIALLWGVHLVRTYLLDPQQDLQLVIEGAFIPFRYTIPFSAQTLAWLWSPLTYSFLHGNFTHIVVNTVWMAAFGAVVARRLGAFRFCLFWVFTSVVSAFTFAAFAWGEQVPVIGASGVVSGLMGAAARFAFPSRPGVARTAVHFLPRLGIIEALGNRTVLTYVAVWFGVNALTAFGVAPGAEGVGAIAWQAHLGGFLAGFLGFGLFDRRDWA